MERKSEESEEDRYAEIEAALWTWTSWKFFSRAG